MQENVKELPLRRLTVTKKFQGFQFFVGIFFHVCQNKKDYKKYCTLLSENEDDKDNGLNIAFYKKPNSNKIFFSIFYFLLLAFLTP